MRKIILFKIHNLKNAVTNSRLEFLHSLHQICVQIPYILNRGGILISQPIDNLAIGSQFLSFSLGLPF